MELEDDATLYCTVRVSSPIFYYFSVLCIIHSVASGAWQTVEEFLKTYLKNKCSYARKRGYLSEKTNQRQGRHDEEDEEGAGHGDIEDEDEDEEEQEQEEGEGQGEEQEQEQGEDQWTRGNGWGVNGFEDNYAED